MTQQQINSLTINDTDNTQIYNGSTVYYLLQEYSARYMICDSVNNFIFKWAAYNNYKLPDFLRAYKALYAEYNPLNNYDMTVSNTETHDTTTMTIDDTTYTADKINAHELTRSGNIGVMSTVDLIKQELSLRSQSLIYDYVYSFIERYTFYAAGGECYEYTAIENN